MSGHETEVLVELDPVQARTLIRMTERHGGGLAKAVDRLLDYALTTLPPDRLVEIIKGGSA